MYINVDLLGIYGNIKIQIISKGGVIMTTKRNDRVDGLKASVSIKNGLKKCVILKYAGKYGQGYDGCGAHTHK